MKEYLVKTEEGKWHYTNDDHDVCPKYVEKIEIPIGTIAITNIKDIYLFWLDDGFVCGLENKKYKPWRSTFAEYLNDVSNSILLWQRQPENQEPLDDVKWFEGDLKVSDGYTIGEDCNSNKKHNHYFKNVKHLDYVDVYRVLDLFEVVDPCIQHSIKKLLCAGMRGAKNQPQDVQEAIDSLVRYQEMRKEDRK